MTNFLLAVNGTLMGGLELNKNLLDVGAEFIQETTTEPSYRMWSIADRYPAMVKVRQGGKSIVVEDGICTILSQEPPGLCIGKISLIDGTIVLGVLGEPYLCENQTEITAWGGWRAYVTSLESSTR